MFNELNSVLAEMGLLDLTLADLKEDTMAQENINGLIESELDTLREQLVTEGTEYILAIVLPELARYYKAREQLYDLQETDLTPMPVTTQYYYKITPIEPGFVRSEVALDLNTLANKASDMDLGQVWRDAVSYGRINATATTLAEAQQYGYFLEKEESEPIIDVEGLMADYGRWAGLTCTTKEVNPHDISPHAYIDELLTMAYKPPRHVVEEFLGNFYSGTEVLDTVNTIAWE